MGKTIRYGEGRKSRAGISFKLSHVFARRRAITAARQAIENFPIDCIVPIGRLFTSKIPMMSRRAFKNNPNAGLSADL